MTDLAQRKKAFAESLLAEHYAELYAAATAKNETVRAAQRQLIDLITTLGCYDSGLIEKDELVPHFTAKVEEFFTTLETL